MSASVGHLSTVLPDAFKLRIWPTLKPLMSHKISQCLANMSIVIFLPFVVRCAAANITRLKPLLKQE